MSTQQSKTLQHTAEIHKLALLGARAAGWLWQHRGQRRLQNLPMQQPALSCQSKLTQVLVQPTVKLAWAALPCTVNHWCD